MDIEKNILILSCSTGEGHNSAAYAVEEAFARRNVHSRVLDPVSFHSEKATVTIADLYNNLIKKAPHLFGAVYQLGAAYSATRITSPVYLANASYAGKLAQYIRKNRIDAVVCTHLYGMEAVRAAKVKYGLTTPCYGVFTDYTCSPFLEETRLDGYFVPHEEIRQEFIRKGADPKRIIVTGIPVSERFRHHTDKQEARRQLQIPADKPILLIMTGGVGCENMLSLCHEICHDSGDITAYILTGRNDKLRQKIEERFADSPKIRAVGFTKQVNLYMDAADVMVSKSGGLSSTEAAVAGIPLIHFKAIPGCESKNRDFFCRQGMSLCAKDNRDVIRCAHQLTGHPEMADAMIRRQHTVINAQAAEDIVTHVLGGV